MVMAFELQIPRLFGNSFHHYCYSPFLHFPFQFFGPKHNYSDILLLACVQMFLLHRSASFPTWNILKNSISDKYFIFYYIYIYIFSNKEISWFLQNVKIIRNRMIYLSLGSWGTAHCSIRNSTQSKCPSLAAKCKAVLPS